MTRPLDVVNGNKRISETRLAAINETKLCFVETCRLIDEMRLTLFVLWGDDSSNALSASCSDEQKGATKWTMKIVPALTIAPVDQRAKQSR